MRDLYERCEQCGAPTARYTLLHLSEDLGSYGYSNTFHYELGGHTRRIPEVEIRAIRADLGHICATPVQVDKTPIDRDAPPPEEASLDTIQEASGLMASTTGDIPGSVLDFWIRQNQGVTVKIGQSKYRLSALDVLANRPYDADGLIFDGSPGESCSEQTKKKGSETMSVYARSKKNVGEGLQVGAGRKVAKRMNQKIKEAIVKTSGLDPAILDNKVLDALIYMLAPAVLMTAAPHIPMIPQKKTQRALDFAQVGGSSIIGEDFSDVVEDILGPILGSMAEVVATSLGEDEDTEE